MDDQDSISIIWHIDDVKDLRKGITDEQARAVLAKVKHHHDANYGISWETLECALCMLYPEYA